VVGGSDILLRKRAGSVMGETENLVVGRLRTTTFSWHMLSSVGFLEHNVAGRPVLRMPQKDVDDASRRHGKCRWRRSVHGPVLWTRYDARVWGNCLMP
jgi:hypothetical protein